jgi:hypothetical protein
MTYNNLVYHKRLSITIKIMNNLFFNNLFSKMKNLNFMNNNMYF